MPNKVFLYHLGTAYKRVQGKTEKCVG